MTTPRKHFPLVLVRRRRFSNFAMRIPRSVLNPFAVGLLACCGNVAIEASEAIGAFDGAVVELSPFVVDGSNDEGYRATNAISGTRLNASLRSLPLPIEVVTEALVADIGATDLREALSYSAGVLLASQNDAGSQNSYQHLGSVHNPEGATADPSQSVYKMRGFITDSTLRDGFRRQFAVDSINIERVEIVRGPSALLYGIGNFGGIVNYLPWRPPAAPTASASVTFGNHGHWRGTFLGGGPLETKPRLRYHLAAAFERNGSFTELMKDRRTFVAPSFLLGLSDRTEALLDFEFSRSAADAVGFQSVRARANAYGQQDRLERAGFLELPGKSLDTMRWSGPDTFLDRELSGARGQVTHRFGEALHALIGYSVSRSEFDSRDLSGGIETSVGPPELRSAVHVRPIDAVNGDSEFAAGPVPDAIFAGRWIDAAKDVGRDQARLELNYEFHLFPNSELGRGKQRLLLGHSSERSKIEEFKRGTLENERVFWNPADPAYIRWGLNGNGSPAPPYEDIALTRDDASNEGTYLVYHGQSLKDRLTIVAGVRRDRSALKARTSDFPRDTETAVASDPVARTTTQWGASYALTRELSLFALKAEGLAPNFEGFRDAWGRPMEAVTARSEEVGMKFDLFNGRLSGTVSAYRIEQMGTPIFYWWAPAPTKGIFRPGDDIVYNVADFNPSVDDPSRNGALAAAVSQWDEAVAAGAAYQIDEAWYVNASQPAGAAYLDAVMGHCYEVGGWPGWLYIQDSNTNNASQDWAADSAGGYNAYLSGDQKSHGWEAQIIGTPIDAFQFSLSYAYTQREVSKAGAFPAYPYAAGNWDRWAIWYFPDAQWGLTGYRLDQQFSDPADTSTWQGRGYGAGERQDDTPAHAVSFWSNYNQADGRLRGLSLGLGAKWESEREYFSGITDGAGQLVVDADGDRVVLKTDDRWVVDGMARYAFALGERELNVQLNLYNVLNDQRAYGFLFAEPISYRLRLGIEF